MLRIRMTATLAALLLVVIAGAADAAANPSADQDSGPVEAEKTLVSPSPSDGSYYTVEVEEEPEESYTDIDVLGKVTSYKCKVAKVAYTRHTLFGSVAYRFWMRRGWCWRYPRLVSVGTTTYVTDMDGLNEYDGIVSASGFWFQWCCNEPHSGHSAFRQGEFHNCIFRYGCLSTVYPWIRMKVRGNGTYTYSVGD